MTRIPAPREPRVPRTGGIRPRRAVAPGLVLLGVLAASACGPFGGDREDGGGPFRVAVARFQHETCTFCPGPEVTVEDWTRLREPLEGREVLETGSYVRGFRDRMREYGDVELVGVRSPYAVFGGSSRGWNREETFEHFSDMIVSDLRKSLPVDGVYLSLHGAMAVRNVARPEAELARRVREVVGPRVPIVATFDLHGNEDGVFLDHADGAVVTKRYPHYDAYLQGERAARFLLLSMRGDYRPTTASRKPPVITATVLQGTRRSPAMDVMERARRWEARQNDAFVSVFFGYPWSDAPDVGATVHVMTNGDQRMADLIADDMARYIWRVREELAHGEFSAPREAVRRARRAIARGDTPVVLADYSDRSGDATWILRELMDQGVDGVLYATLRDERVLGSLAARGDTLPGRRVTVSVGGFTGPAAGRPVRIRGILRFWGGQFGYDRVAVIDYDGESTLILTPTYEQVVSPEELRFGPVDPDRYRAFVLKSPVHFRRGFDETGYAGTIIVTDAPGDWVGTTRLDALDYEHAPIDSLYPFGTPPPDWMSRETLSGSAGGR